MSKRERRPELPAGADLIPESVVRAIADERRAESELTLVTSRLAAVPLQSRDPGAKVDDYVDNLTRRRAELLELVQPVSPSGDVRTRRIDSLVSVLGPFFTPWTTVNLPYFAEGIDETPGIKGTSGSLQTESLSAPGAVAFWGNPNDAGTVNPSVEKWWLHNWTCSYVFPPAPATGKLYYRFTVQTSWEVVAAAAMSGLVNAFVTVGTTSDVRAGGPLDPGSPKETTWPFWFTLPQPNYDIYVNQPLSQISGSVDVQAGRNAAIGLIFGVAAGIASGYVSLLGGLMETRLFGTTPAMTPFILDEIEYRFESAWWEQAIGQRLEEATAG